MATTGAETTGQQDLPSVSVRRPYLAAVLNLLIVVAGLSAIFGVEVRELPDVDRPIITVRATVPGASPETVDAEVTAILESAVARVNGVQSVRSASEENNLRIRAEFSPAANLIDAANDVREAVSRVERRLPDGVENVFVIKADSDARPVVRIAATSGALPIEALSRRIETEVVPELMAVEGVADVRLFGERDRVLRVVLDPMRLASRRLSVLDVVATLERARFDVRAGSFQSDDQDVMVRANASVATPEDVEALIIREPVRIGDVASAFFAPSDADAYVRLDGEAAVNISVIRQAKANTIAISRGVDKALAALNARLTSIRLETKSDEARFIQGAIKEVLLSLALAALIVFGVIATFLGHARLALIPAAAIPVALIGSVAAIWMLGFSINLVTLFALVLATGLVVDDAIVVLENIQRQRAFGAKARAAAVLGARQVFFAVLATTATLVSVFLPISFLPSTAGRLFAEFGVVLAIAICVSSFVALTLCPMLASRLPDRDEEAKRPRRAALIARQLQKRLGRLYGDIIERIVFAPMLLVVLCIIMSLGACVVYAGLGEELAPREDRGLIRVRLTAPDGVGIDYTDRQVEKAEKALGLLVDAGLATSIFSISGRNDPNRGQIDAPLVDWGQRSATEADIAASVNDALRSIPGARSRIVRRNALGLRSSGGGLAFALTGSDYAAIQAAAIALVEKLDDHAPQLDRTRIRFRATQPQLNLDIDRRRAAALGVPIESLDRTLRALVDNDVVSRLVIDDVPVRVILQAVPGAVADPESLGRLYVPARDGALTPLAQLVRFSEEAVASQLDRRGQRRAILLAAEPADGVDLREAVDALTAVAEDALPADVGLLLLGEAATLDETSNGVALTFAIAFLIVFLVLIAQFESIGSAAVVFLTVPFGICAAILALGLSGSTINLFSQIGALLLIGVMAKNSILMVEFADQLRERGLSALEAARQASIIRARAIVMTMASTVLAGLPLILGSGPGAEARAAIGWVVFGGLGLAALFTLFLTPALYVLLAPYTRSRNEETARLAEELAEASKTLEMRKSVGPVV
ncbi:MAG: efflux RND transporter permease subunit [Pseudomonadota bacterium]